MLVSFSPVTGHTLPDRYIEGTCPICGYPEARGDQCDNCGNQLDPTDLIDPRSRIDGSTPEFRETKHLFLDLPQFADAAARRGSRSHDDWRPNVRNFSLALLDEIRPRPITRDLDWGVPIPVPGLRGGREQADLRLVRRGHRLPVGDRSSGRPRPATPTPGASGGRTPTSEHYYFQGKDNIVFHTVIWPAMLLGYGEGGEYGAGRGPLELPDNVVATEFLTMDGQAVLDEPRALDLRPRLPRPLRRRRAPLLPRRREPGDAGHRLHLGRVRPPQQRRAARELGQPRQPDAHERAPELRRRPRAGRAHRARRGAARGDRRAASTTVGALIERGTLPGGARRGDAALVARSTSTSANRAVGARQDRPRPRRRPSSTSRSAPSTA